MNPHQFLERPTKEAIRELPKFDGLPLEKICLVRTADDLFFAHNEILNVSQVGFDTESKPNFVANQPKTGPHLVQIATSQYAFLFTLDYPAGNELLSEVIRSDKIVKVGFGLKSDRGPICNTLGVALDPTIELSAAVRRLGYKQQVGVQAAVAVVLGQYLQKSKNVTTSNWAAKTLSDSQLLYAANDAYASLCVYHELVRIAPHVLASVKNCKADPPSGNPAYDDRL
ncbi:MAG: 3'-5' exonuclease domain-containing protein 2 [Methylobacter sp.]|nr:MAG: 3'-5' exonuclease domain-containing protein 2 [Methylobacter sp.]